MPPYHHVKVTWGSRHGSGAGGGGWGSLELGSPHRIIRSCTVDKRSILNVHFKEETSLLIQKRKSARYENPFCSL